MASERIELDMTSSGVTLDLRLGTAWALYVDRGPSGPCGQGMRITCSHAQFHTWPTEDDMRRELPSIRWRNKKHVLFFGVVGEYTSGGAVSVVNHASSIGPQSAQPASPAQVEASSKVEKRLIEQAKEQGDA